MYQKQGQLVQKAAVFCVAANGAKKIVAWNIVNVFVRLRPRHFGIYLIKILFYSCYSFFAVLTASFGKGGIANAAL